MSEQHGALVATSLVVEARGLRRVYTTGPEPVVAIDGVDLAVESQSMVVVKGRSGSGKTTLLNLLGGLDQPTEGSVSVVGNAMSELDDSGLADLRRNRIGFIFQAFGLIPILTAAENVEIPLRLVRTDPVERRERAHELLVRVGLGARTRHRPAELSGGEQQRVAVARALANRPDLLLADEPTGQLDSRTGAAIVDLIAELVDDQGLAAVVVTHDPMPAARADRVYELADGRLADGPSH